MNRNICAIYLTVEARTPQNPEQYILWRVWFGLGLLGSHRGDKWNVYSLKYALHLSPTLNQPNQSGLLMCSRIGRHGKWRRNGDVRTARGKRNEVKSPWRVPVRCGWMRLLAQPHSCRCCLAAATQRASADISRIYLRCGIYHGYITDISRIYLISATGGDIYSIYIDYILNRGEYMCNIFNRES